MSSPWHDIHPEQKGIVSDPHGPSRSVLLCLGCGKLPPHTGSEAICPACTPPNASCSCPGCALVQPYRDRLDVLAEEARGMLAMDPTKAPVALLSLAEFAEQASACACRFDSAAGVFVPLRSCPVHGHQVTP
jgi:hypothetical protein